MCLFWMKMASPSWMETALRKWKRAISTSPRSGRTR